MNIKKLLFLTISHFVIGIVGFAIGIFSLPILTAPPSPTETEIKALSVKSNFSAEFTKDLKGSDFLHWGEGNIAIGEEHITFMGELSPGPDFKLYLSPKFVEDETEFNRLKSKMKVAGDVNTFTNFVVELPPNTDLTEFNTVIVWCESFGEFITSAKYR